MSNTAAIPTNATLPVDQAEREDAGREPSPATILAGFASRLHGLNAAVEETTQRMAEALDGLRSSGHLPGHGLVVSLGRSHRELTRLRNDLLAEAARHGLKIRPSWRLAGVRELDEFLDALRSRMAAEGERSFSEADANSPTVAELHATAPPAPQAAVVDTALIAEEATDVVPASAHDFPTDSGESTESSHGGEPAAGASPPEAPAMLAQPIENPAEWSPGEIAAVEAPLPPCTEESSTDDRPEPIAALPSHSDAREPDDPARDAALDVLERASRLALRDGSPLAELTAYHDRVDELRRTILDGHTGEGRLVAAELAGRTHPVAQLVNAVDGSDDLTDEQWADLHTLVGEMFGRPLAVALARHRLVLTPPTPAERPATIAPDDGAPRP